MGTIKIDKKALFDLIRLKEEFELIVESIELSSNPEVMASLKSSKKQIKRGELVDFNDL